jgi:hypothetical protein
MPGLANPEGLLLFAESRIGDQEFHWSSDGHLRARLRARFPYENGQDRFVRGDDVSLFARSAS